MGKKLFGGSGGFVVTGHWVDRALGHEALGSGALGRGALGLHGHGVTGPWVMEP